MERPALLNQHVDAVVVIGEQLLDQRVDALALGDVAGVDVGSTPGDLDLTAKLLQLVGAARYQHWGTSALGHLQRGRPADAGGRPGDHDRAARQRAAGPHAAGPVGIEVAFPVGPQSARVGRQRWDAEPAAGKGRTGGVAGEAAAEGQVRENLGWDAGGDDVAGSRDRSQPLGQRRDRQQRPGDPAVDRARDVRGAGGGAEGVDHVDERLGRD